MAQIPRCIVSIHCKISKCIVSIHDENAKCIERIQPYRQSSAAGENFHNQYVVFRFSCWKSSIVLAQGSKFYLSISQMYWINTCIVSIHAKFSNPGCTLVCAKLMRGFSAKFFGTCPQLPSTGSGDVTAATGQPDLNRANFPDPLQPSTSEKLQTPPTSYESEGPDPLQPSTSRKILTSSNLLRVRTVNIPTPSNLLRCWKIPWNKPHQKSLVGLDPSQTFSPPIHTGKNTWNETFFFY